MDQTPANSARTQWAFWIAGGLAVVAAVAPLLLGGGSNRITTAVVPLALSALAFVACALLYRQGRPITTLLYFLASLAVVYGILTLLALPLRLAVVGTCVGPGACGIGLERPMTTAETSALGFSIGIGIVAILTGFFGLRVLYHSGRPRAQADTSTSPPARRIPPVTPRSEASTTPVAKPNETSTAVMETPAQPAPAPEPAAQAPELEELPAHEPDLELPAHATESAKATEIAPVTESAPAAAGAAPMPAPPRSRRQRKPKAPPEPPTPTGTE